MRSAFLLGVVLASCSTVPSRGPCSAGGASAANEAPNALVTSDPHSAADAALWRAIQTNGYALPSDVALESALARLRRDLGALDPVLRDELPYDVARHWLFPKRLVDDGALRAHADALVLQLDVAGLRAGAVTQLGSASPDDERVLARSFAALHLSLLAASDLKEPLFDDAGWRRVFDGALDYLAAERDVRGWVEGSGWHHSVAHTADLLKFLARSPRLAPADQARLVLAIEAKLAALPHVLVWGEDERLAAVFVSLARRVDFDAAGFEAWLARERERRAAVWSTEPFSSARFVAARNARDVLVALLLALDAAAESEPALVRARDAVRASLRDG